jgi:hypothetical protein
MNIFIKAKKGKCEGDQKIRILEETPLNFFYASKKIEESYLEAVFHV